MKKFFAIASLVMMLMISGCTCGRQQEAVVEETAVEVVDTTVAPVDTLVIEVAE